MATLTDFKGTVVNASTVDLQTNVSLSGRVLSTSGAINTTAITAVIPSACIVNSCSYVISPATQNFSAAAGSGTVQLTAGSTCTWTAASACAYVVVNNGSGTGSATISYTVSANVGAAARTCTILIGGQTHTIVQSGTSSCSYVISPASSKL